MGMFSAVIREIKRMAKPDKPPKTIHIPIDQMEAIKHRVQPTDARWLATCLVDTIIPYKENHSPFSPYEIEYHATRVIEAMSDADKLTLHDLLYRNRGKRDFNKRIPQWQCEQLLQEQSAKSKSTT